MKGLHQNWFSKVKRTLWSGWFVDNIIRPRRLLEKRTSDMTSQRCLDGVVVLIVVPFVPVVVVMLKLLLFRSCHREGWRWWSGKWGGASRSWRCRGWLRELRRYGDQRSGSRSKSCHWRLRVQKRGRCCSELSFGKLYASFRDYCHLHYYFHFNRVTVQNWLKSGTDYCEKWNLEKKYCIKYFLLGLKTGIWALRLGYGHRGWDTLFFF